MTAHALAALPADILVTDPDVLTAYRTDQAPFCPAGAPLALARPRTVAEVQHVMELANAARIPVVPQGARTGLSGGANGWTAACC